MSANITNLLHIKLNRLERNWGAPFIIGFISLLVVAGALLAMGLVIPAEVIGDLAYFALLIGIILQSAYFLRAERRRGAKKNVSK